MQKEFEQKAGPRRGANVNKKHTETIERIRAWFGRGARLEERGAHAKGCSCGFCKNKGKIADHWKKKLDAASKGGGKEEEEPKDMTEGLEKLIETSLAGSQVKLSKGSTIGSANKAYHNMSSKQAMTPEFKPKAYQKAAAEATNQVGRMKGFKNKSEGETNSGKALPKKRAGESAQRVAATLLGD